MKTVAIVAISAGVSVAVIGALVGIGAYQQAQQQAQLEKEQREANQAFINLLQKVAESEQKQPTTNEPAKSIPSLPQQDCAGSSGCFSDYVTRIMIEWELLENG